MCVCVDGNYPELLGAAPQASRAPRRRGGARTTCMVVRPGHTYLHNTFNTY
jgi:3-methyladenine DNA glycosylase Mpg